MSRKLDIKRTFRRLKILNAQKRWRKKSKKFTKSDKRSLIVPASHSFWWNGPRLIIVSRALVRKSHLRFSCLRKKKKTLNLTIRNQTDQSLNLSWKSPLISYPHNSLIPKFLIKQHKRKFLIECKFYLFWLRTWLVTYTRINQYEIN